MVASSTMKLILIVKTKNRPKTFASNCLQFISRSGFDYRVNIKRNQFERYMGSVQDSELRNYLYIPQKNFKKKWARIPASYDLVLYVPDQMPYFTADKLLSFVQVVNKMRSEMAEKQTNSAKFLSCELVMEKLTI